ncbi:MAG: hypothetical protein WC071_01665 [Victivallaceae bacterium]
MLIRFFEQTGMLSSIIIIIFSIPVTSFCKNINKSANCPDVLYYQGFEKEDALKFYAANGKYTLKHKGITDSKSHSGKKCVKLDVVLDECTYLYFFVPVSIPLLHESEAQAYFAVDKESTVRSVNFGINMQYIPFGKDGLEKIEAPNGGSFNGEWIKYQADLFKLSIMRQETWSKKYWGVEEDNVGILMDKLCVLISGKKGSKATIYIDDLLVTGKTVDLTEFKNAIRKKWRSVKDKVDLKFNEWNAALDKYANGINQAIATNSKAETLKKHSISNIAEVRSKIGKLQNINVLSLRDYAEIMPVIDSLKYLKDNIHEMNKCGGGICAIYVVNPVSSIKILPDSLVIPGKISKNIEITACNGEFEPASFVVKSDINIDSLNVKTSDLKSDNNTINAAFVDIKAVKCWYQAGSAWYQITQDKSQKALVPELLLNDNSLIKIDCDKKDNYVKLDMKDGTKYVNVKDIKKTTIDNFPVKDSPEFKPLSIPAGKASQIWITVKIPDEAKPGIYNGEISLFNSNTLMDKITIKVNVLPFKLLEPYLASSIYYLSRLNRKYPAGVIGAEFGAEWRSEKQLRAELKNMIDHGITRPINYQFNISFDSDRELLVKYINACKESGIKLDSIFTMQCFGNTINDSDLQKITSKVRQMVDFVKPYGTEELYFYGIDEAQEGRLMSQRKVWQAIKNGGGKIYAAGKRAKNFESMGDLQDMLICAGAPFREEAERWHRRNKKIFIYANPMAGVENPEIFRRNYGFMLWKSKYDGIANYQGSFGNGWNDFDHPQYRDHSFVYPTVNGVINTIAFEGYREAIDDIRYLTTLLREIDIAKNSTNSRLWEHALAAEDFLEKMDAEKNNLQEIRDKIIQYILQLKGL